MVSIAYRIDIDNTIATPQWYDNDLQICIRYYLDQKIITEHDRVSIEYHTQLFMLPQVALTHSPMQGAVTVLQQLAQEGFPVEYYTARNSVQPEKCKKMHENTHLWLEKYQFPNPDRVHFVWDISEKWTHTLDAPGQYIVIIDDRPEELLQAYRALAKNMPQAATHVREHMLLIAFQQYSLEQFSTVPEAPRIFSLPDWMHFAELLPQIQRECS
jgi:hypothetical protein